MSCNVLKKQYRKKINLIQVVGFWLTGFCICFSQELENLRAQAEIIPQLMAECESITAKLQVRSKHPGIPQTPHFSQVWFTAEYKSLSSQHTWVHDVCHSEVTHYQALRRKQRFHTEVKNERVLPEGWWHNIPVTCLTNAHCGYCIY